MKQSCTWPPNAATLPLNDYASTCRLLCASDGVDENAVDNNGKTALAIAIFSSQVDAVRALLEFNIDTSKTVVDAETRGEIVQLLDEHRQRSVKYKYLFLFGI